MRLYVNRSAFSDDRCFGLYVIKQCMGGSACYNLQQGKDMRDHVSLSTRYGTRVYRVKSWRRTFLRCDLRLSQMEGRNRLCFPFRGPRRLHFCAPQ